MINWKSLINEKTNTVLTLIAILVAIGIGYLQIRSKTRELKCLVSNSAELTSVSQVPGLTAEFKYTGKPVAHLWRIDFSLVNTGDETLIGEGQHSTLIKEGLYFFLPSQATILNAEIVSADLPATLEVKPPSTLLLKFSQWRKSESVTVNAFVTSDVPFYSPMLPEIKTRDIVDGQVFVIDTMNSPPPRKRLFERLPGWIEVVIKIGLSIACVFFCYWFLWRMGKSIIAYGRRKWWFYRHYNAYKKFIEKSDLSESSKNFYLKDPNWIGGH